MASWPENGTTNWNPEMLVFTGVEHNTDGTHDLATIGWTGTIVETRDLSTASGDVAYTGAGFAPRLVILFVSVSGNSGASWGCDNVTDSECINQNYLGTMNPFSGSVNIQTQAGANGLRGSIASLDPDGFTMAWLKIEDGSGPPTGTATIIALCFK